MNSTTANVSFRALTWWASMARYWDIHAPDLPAQLRLPQVVVDRLDADHASRPAPLRLHREIARVGAHISTDAPRRSGGGSNPPASRTSKASGPSSRSSRGRIRFAKTSSPSSVEVPRR